MCIEWSLLYAAVPFRFRYYSLHFAEILFPSLPYRFRFFFFFASVVYLFLYLLVIFLFVAFSLCDNIRHTLSPYNHYDTTNIYWQRARQLWSPSVFFSAHNTNTYASSMCVYKYMCTQIYIHTHTNQYKQIICSATDANRASTAQRVD
jgi:hypothetical protein